MEHLSIEIQSIYNLGPSYLENEVLIEHIKILKKIKVIISEMIEDSEEDLANRVSNLKRVEDIYDLDSTVVKRVKKE